MSTIQYNLAVLGLKPGASWNEVNESYRDLMRVWHPDRFQGDERLLKKASDKTVAINSAMQSLRAEYDPEKAKAEPQNPKPPRPREPTTENTQRVATSTAKQRTSQAPVVPALLVFKSLKPSFIQLGVGLCLALVGYASLNRQWLDSPSTAFGVTVIFAGLSLLIRSACLITMRRPAIRVDSVGVWTNTRVFPWVSIGKIWSCQQASRPALGIQYSDVMLKKRSAFVRAYLKLQMIVRKNHASIPCAGLSLLPNDVVASVNEHYETGSIEYKNIVSLKESSSIMWCRIGGVLSASALIIRCLLEHRLTAIDFAFYFGVFTACQAYQISSRILRVSDRVD